MKAQTKKSKTTAKAAVKPIKKPAAAPKAQSKGILKPLVKAKAAAAAKPARAVKVAKPAKAKPAVATKKPVKPAAKAAVVKKSQVLKPQSKKSMAKPAAKPVGKPAPKAISKPVSKTIVKAKPATKSAVQPPTTSAAKPVVKTTGQPVPKTAQKSEPKTLTQVNLQASVKAIKMSPAAVPLKKQGAAAPPAVVATPSGNGLPPPPPLKPGRRSSSRAFAHMPPPAPMVPTHAPDAAKASYSTMTERTVAPPPHVAAKKDPKLANNWKTKTGETLSDDEVKAMPDSEYMNEKQLAFFRAKLSVQKQEIHNSAGATTEHLREDTVVVPDPADRATIEEEHALELRTRDRERKLLKKIEQSIGRIDSGDYGYCDETGEPIGVGRLIARPTASLSLEAQQRRELKQKMFGD